MKFDWVPEDRKSLMKRIMILSIIAVAAILLYLWHEAIGDFFGKCIKVLKPLLYAIVIAYILWPMLRFFETKVFAGLEKKKPNKKLVRFLSLLVTYIIFLLILILFLSMVIPQIAESVTSLIALASGYISNIQDWFMNISPETPVIGPLIDTELFVELRGTLIGYLKDAVEWLTGNLKKYHGRGDGLREGNLEHRARRDFRRILPALQRESLRADHQADARVDEGKNL